MSIRRTFAGITFGSAATQVSFGTGDVTAAGLGIDGTDAAALPYTVNNVSGADGNTSVILPAPDPGAYIEVYAVTAGHQLNIFPHSGGTINGGAGNSGIHIDPQTRAMFVCTDGTNWGAQYTYTRA